MQIVKIENSTKISTNNKWLKKYCSSSNTLRLKIVWSIKRRNTMNYRTIGIPIDRRPKQQQQNITIVKCLTNSQ